MFDSVMMEHHLGATVFDTGFTSNEAAKIISYVSSKYSSLDIYGILNSDW